MVAPLSTTSVMATVWVVSTANSFSYLSQGLSVVCLCPKLSLRPSTSNSRTITSILSPRVRTSEGCFTFFVHDKSEIYTKPSIPSSNSIKTPKLVKFLTKPECLEPIGYLEVMSVHGSGVICLIPKDILRDSRSIDKITATTSSPTFTKSCAERKCVDQDISET